APDVGRFHDRLRPRWLDPWLEHPTWIYPGTTMTELYPDPGDRKTAIDVLMNWPRVRPAPPNPE
ncbi:MAG TPA: hypothetical protein VI643_03295, partial [Planctomycetota bacterium]|nr:hypothetical protein [Planctomycetota bacterium]